MAFGDINILLYVIALSVCAGFCRFIFSTRLFSLLELLRGLTLSLFVGLNVYALLFDFLGSKAGSLMAFTSVAAFLSDHVLTSLIKLAEDISKKPQQLIKRFLIRK